MFRGRERGIVGFSSWLDIMRLFGLQFRRTFLTILPATFYFVGLPSFNGMVFFMPLYSSFFLNESSCFHKIYTHTYMHHIYILTQHNFVNDN